MRNQILKSKVLQILAVAVAFGFFSVAQAQVDNYPVEVKLNGDQTKLIITTKGRCSHDDHKGCIDVPNKKKARIKFSLKQKQCTKPDGKNWEIGEVYLGGKNSQSKPGDSGWGGLDSEVKADFNVADAASGQLDKEAGSSKNSIVIFDENDSKYDIWYKVTAVCVDSSGNVLHTAKADPRIKNGGSL